MKSRPRIAVSRWEDVPGERLQFYWDRVTRAGADVVDLGPDVALEFDALVLTGGIDVDPSVYGAERHPKVKYFDIRRDEFELNALRHALESDLPVLAICRGHQLLNVAFGGSLLQHIEGDSHRAQKEEGMPSRWHSVALQPGARLAGIYGREEMEVNSRHHQAVLPGTLGPGLHAIAHAPDGLVEGVVSDTHSWVVGVQWHPERPEPEHPGFADRNAALFEALVAATSSVGQLA